MYGLYFPQSQAQVKKEDFSVHLAALLRYVCSYSDSAWRFNSTFLGYLFLLHLILWLDKKLFQKPPRWCFEAVLFLKEIRSRSMFSEKSRRSLLYSLSPCLEYCSLLFPLPQLVLPVVFIKSLFRQLLAKNDCFFNFTYANCIIARYYDLRIR